MNIGNPVPEPRREQGINSSTVDKWCVNFDGMDASLMARLREFEEENRRL